MQRLDVTCAVRPLQGPLGVKRLIMLRCGGSSGLGCEIPLVYGDRDVCVSRVVDYSSLVMHGTIPLFGKYEFK